MFTAQPRPCLSFVSWYKRRGVQVGHTGNLAFITIAMNFAGSAARVFTTLQARARARGESRARECRRAAATDGAPWFARARRR